MPTDLAFEPALSRPDLLAGPVAAALASPGLAGSVEAAPIDPDLSDTAAFCAAYGIAAAESANCVVVAGKRGQTVTYAACVVLATTRADVNGLVRRRLDARKVSFAAREDVARATAMEFGGITPIGLPGDWPILVDAAVAAATWVVIGRGLRRSKLALAGTTLPYRSRQITPA